MHTYALMIRQCRQRNITAGVSPRSGLQNVTHRIIKAAGLNSDMCSNGHGGRCPHVSEVCGFTKLL